MNIARDIEFKKIGDRRLLLDVYVPDGGARPAPVIVWICGGGWAEMSKEAAEDRSAWIVEHGFALVPFQYRLSDEATFPAQIEDCKAAVRWVRANAEEHGFDTAHVGAWGDSAGGHLASLLGTSAAVASFDADGFYEGYSSEVQAVCAFYPPADFTYWSDKWKSDTNEVVKMLGGHPRDIPDLARAASPVCHVSASSAPHLVVHGDADEVVPMHQSERLRDTLSAAGVEVTLEVLPGIGHSGEATYGNEHVRKVVAAFFRKHLKRTLRETREIKAKD